MAVGGIGGVAGAIITRRLARRLGTARVLVLAALASGLSGLLLPLTSAGPAVAFYIVGAAVSGAGKSSGTVIIASFRQAYCPPRILGRVITTQRIFGYGTVPLGALPAGGLSTALGVRAALWAVIISALSGTLLLTPAIRADRNLPQAAAAA